MTIKTTRICAGLYEVTDGENVVSLTYHDHLRGWIASAEWDAHRHTDPVRTKAVAKFNAEIFLKNAPTANI